MTDRLLEHKEFFISAVGIIVTVLISILAFFQGKKQRSTTYRPDILVKSFRIKVGNNPFTNQNIEPIRFSIFDHAKNNNLDENIFEESIRIEVINVGLGNAKEIQIKWSFDFKSAMALIEKMLPYYYEINYIKDINYHSLTTNRDDNFKFCFSGIIEKQFIDYISTENSNNEFFVKIPESIIKAHYLFIVFKRFLYNTQYLDNVETDILDFNFNDYLEASFDTLVFSEYNFPKPNIKIEYRDLDSKKYIKRFKFNVTANFMDENDCDNITDEFIDFEFHLK